MSLENIQYIDSASIMVLFVGNESATGSLFGTASWANNVISSSYAVTASYASNGVGGGTTLVTASTYQITSSWSNNNLSTSINSNDNGGIYYLTLSTGSGQQPLYIDTNNIIYNKSNSQTWMTSISSSNVTSSQMLLTGSTSSSSLAVITSINNFSSINIQNLNGGNTASTDFIAINDKGNITSGSVGYGFIDMGINGSQYTGGFIGSANDSYFFSTSSGHLFIGNISPVTNLYLFAGGYSNTASVTLSSSGLFIIPSGSMTGSHFGTSSWAINSITSTSSSFGSASISSSYSLTSSYMSLYNSYLLLTTSSTNWVTVSFNSASNQVLNLNITASYNFTQSNVSALGQVSDVVLFISYSVSAFTSSLSFPSNWINIGAGWPTVIYPNTIATMWLRSINTNEIIGTYNVSGSSYSASYAGFANTTALASFAISSSFASSSLSASFLNGPHTGSVFGTSSNAVSASYSVTSSYTKNATTSSQGCFAWAWMCYNGSNMTSSTYNCTITRSSAASYAVSFVNAGTNANYAVTTTGFSGSAATVITASFLSPINLRTNGFTMSVYKMQNTGSVTSDFTTASFHVFSF